MLRGIGARLSTDAFSSAVHSTSTPSRPGSALAAPGRAARRATSGFDWLFAIAALGIVATYVRAIGFTPLEATQGAAQKIYYIHVPSAWVAFLAFFVVAITGLVYLW